ncbi:MAG: SdrD B-like domain-containing protein [Planctomycetaceae bacterium]
MSNSLRDPIAKEAIMNVQNTLQSISRLWETCIQSPRRRTTSRSHISHELEGRQLLAAVIANAAPTVTTSIEGRVFADANKDGKVNGDEKGLGGRGVQLVDANNKVVATVQTKPDGSFRFVNMPAGTYTVREILPPGATSTTPPKPITVKADSKITGVLVGEAPPAQPQSQSSSTNSVTLQGSLLNSLLS